MTARMLRRSKRGRLHVLWLPVLAAGVAAAAQLSLEPARPPATIDTLDLPVDGEVWASDPIRVDATAVGFEWNRGSAPEHAWVRASEDGETWGPWTEIHDVGDHGPDNGTREAEDAREMSEAVYVGEARWLRFRVEGATPGLSATYVDTTGRNLSLWERIELTLSRIAFGKADAAVAQTERPWINPRSSWGGDECIASVPPEDSEPDYVDRVEILFVHHTLHGGGVNGYSRDDVPDLLYAICSFHVLGNGWDDIGYNLLVDRFGRLWEGRAGGVEENVLGAHTGGFNSYSTGVAFIGDHRWSPPSAEAEAAFLGYASWKLDVHHLDPLGSTTVESQGSSRWEEGRMVRFDTVSGHRDASNTACPGDPTLATLDSWASRLAEMPGTRIYGGWPEDEVMAGTAEIGYDSTSFAFAMTEEMAWTLTISDPSGAEVHREDGVGTEATVVWDGTVDGVPLPFGRGYRVRVEGAPLSGAPGPRPAEFAFQLGSYRPPFSDDDDSIHEQSIAAIAAEGITSGCGEHRFCPLGVLERWQTAVFLMGVQEAVGLPLPAPVDHGFTDLGTIASSARADVDRLAEMRVTTGTGDGTTFEPHGPVLRWQMALFLDRYLDAAGVPDPGDRVRFSDIADLDDSVRQAIERVAAAGITNGTGPGLYDPYGKVTRQQMASFLARTLDILRDSA